MDSITQAALGGALGGAVLGHRFGRAAVVAGALLGTLPDMDVLIDYGDAVANFSQHRGFSHSLLVLVPLAVVLAALLSRWQRSVSFRRWLTFTGAILITHPLLDAFTTYGTQLLWPLGPPVAWHTIFIIDPLYTLPLLVAVIIVLVRPPAIRALDRLITPANQHTVFEVHAEVAIERGPARAPRVLHILARGAHAVLIEHHLRRDTRANAEQGAGAAAGRTDGGKCRAVIARAGAKDDAVAVYDVGVFHINSADIRA